MSTAYVVFKDTDTEGGMEIWVEGVPGSSPLNGAAMRLYEVAQTFANTPGTFGNPEGAMDECRIGISKEDGKSSGQIKLSFDLGKGVSDDSPCSLSQQLVILLMEEFSGMLKTSGLNEG